MNATEVFRNDFLTVHDQEVSWFGGPYVQSTVTVGTLGALVIPVSLTGKGPLVGLTRIDRPTTTRGFSMEFPRGGVERLDAAEARRILLRETGVPSAALGKVGQFLPENGMVDCAVVVYMALVQPELIGHGKKQHVDETADALFSWVPLSTSPEVVSSGAISDGMTLAARTLASPHIGPLARTEHSRAPE